MKSGVYNLIVAYLGYSQKIVFEVVVTNNLPSKVNIGLAPLPNNLNEIEVKANPFIKPQESPLSLTSIGVNEIQRSPGGNRDISKVIQLLPGVSSGVSFRNDLLVRGGGPNENRFYLDGIEVPSINHFQTQGASGGSNGLINVDFIKNVDFYTGAFPANRGNSLSSVMEITQEEGRTDRVGLRATLGASDVGVTLQGPFSKNDKSTF
ncbi:MAG: TonB-dependent receptor plug domain-containing protein [Bacteroidetes bacterium]|nr:TonB-dependent receptor plug domain-containing protein [Bacteroidota bacterium]